MKSEEGKGHLRQVPPRIYESKGGLCTWTLDPPLSPRKTGGKSEIKQGAWLHPVCIQIPAGNRFAKSPLGEKRGRNAFRPYIFLSNKQYFVHGALSGVVQFYDVVA
jgi:hypothetical protein